MPTFLYAVCRALLDQSPKSAALYTHNDAIYCLKTEARRDSQSGERIITGRSSRLGAHSGTEFTLWIASDSDPDLPLRIEFRPKSYLKLRL